MKTIEDAWREADGWETEKGEHGLLVLKPAIGKIYPLVTFEEVQRGGDIFTREFDVYRFAGVYAGISAVENKNPHIFLHFDERYKKVRRYFIEDQLSFLADDLPRYSFFAHYFLKEPSAEEAAREMQMLREADLLPD